MNKKLGCIGGGEGGAFCGGGQGGAFCGGGQGGVCCGKGIGRGVRGGIVDGGVFFCHKLRLLDVCHGGT